MSTIASLPSFVSACRGSRRIIFAHGTFDLFHIGHLSFIKEMRKLGGLLVIGVDHDDNLLYYKGKRRPVFSYDFRIQIIASLSFVDFVLPLPRIDLRDGLDYHYLKLYLRVRPSFVVSGVHFSYAHQVQEKCSLVGAKYRQLRHAHEDVSTSRYIQSIIQDDSGYFQKRFS